MRRSIRTALGLAAASTVIAVGAPAVAASAATAATTTTASATAASFDRDFWGPYYSKYFHGSRAKAKGSVYEDHHGNIHVEGKVYDKGSPWWLCGYVQVKFENEDGDESTYWAKKCGSSGYRYFHYYQDEVDSIQTRVCYWDNHQAKKKYCGRWNYIYEADGEE
ncbi:hypothetical protein Sru01_64340 [Sphaerisporangium rufum]|uniref:Secreted protein n=1 Tax=Sphaerisporangium rufum TaxID=1381558 RepID=A0A919R877_9ACTN|nr:hypothetical protein [Sphaerisporangium rufum]GII81452.1 hypothetical protein Sru01_64340 [Sphaerisporangium rufum]